MKRLLLALCLMWVVCPLRAADDLSVLGQAETNHVPRLPGPDDRLICRLTATLLERMHYAQKPFDQELAGRFLDRYLDALDPQRMLFLQSDVEEFSKYRRTLHHLTKVLGDSMPAEIIYARFLDRVVQQALYVTNLLATEKFVFDTDERFNPNRREAERPQDLKEAQALWRTRLRWEYLNEKLAKKSPEEIQKTILRRYARQVRTLSELDTQEVLQIYLSALAHVYDPHSEYMSKATLENFNINMKLALFGIGAVLSMEDGYCTIQSLSPGGPAERSGQIKPKDRIVMVAQGTNDFVDVVDMKLNKVVEMIRGPKDTVVRLMILPANATDSSAQKEVVLVRKEIKLEDAEAKAKIFELPAANGQPSVRVGVIDLPSFYADMTDRSAGHKSTTSDVAKLLKKLTQEKVAGVIMDLRRNGGGSLEEAINLTGLFIKEGPVVQVKDPDGTITVDKDTDPAVAYDGPLVVLTSRFSASASEIFAGALQDYGRAVVVGDSSTHGKGTVQTVQELNRFARTTNSLGALKFTIRKFYRASGSSTQLKGIIPDIILPSVNNHAEVGEASIPGAMSWDTIPPAKFEPLNVVTPHLAELRRRSEERTARDPDFQWIRQEAERYLKLKQDKTVSLNEAERRKERADQEARTAARKKELRARPAPDYKVYELTLKLAEQPGLPPPVALTNLLATASNKPPASATVEAGEDDAEAEKDEPVPAVDPHLNEARRILVDLIQLLGKEKAIASKTGRE
ncbi:MAG: carboxy terminal-processing peptidase [Verrucomicrobiae bacterium]|nr:carboxy terminal-processing peptidase [Verrucomicrobiae bacterium]